MSKTTSNRKTFQELTFTDNFMFCNVLRENPELCRRLVELLLDVKVKKIKVIESEHTKTINPDIKSIRMDVYLDDDDGTVFDLEMQNSRFRVLPKRSRYYVGMSDTEHMPAGADYNNLPEIFVVFICKSDPFDRNLPVYEFRETCIQDKSLELGDGTHKVFINAAGSRESVSAEMAAFLDYIQDNKPESELTQCLEDSVAEMKVRKDKEKEYMFLMDYFGDEIEEAEARGQERGEKIGQERGEKIGQERGEKIGQERGEKIGQERGEAIGQERATLRERRSAIVNLRNAGFSDDKIMETMNYSIDDFNEALNFSDD